MIEVVRTTTLLSEPDAIWAVLSEFDGISGWASNVDHSCLLSEQREGIGMVRRIQTGSTTVLERVVAWDPPRSLSYAIEGLPPVLKSVTNTWQIEASGMGSTVSLTSAINAGPRPPQKLIAKAVGRKLGEASDEMLSGLKTNLEGAS